MRKSQPEICGIRELHARIKLASKYLAIRSARSAVYSRALAELIEQLPGRVKTCGSRLGYISDTPTSIGRSLTFGQTQQINILNENAPTCETKAGVSKTQCCKAKSRFAGTRLADEANDLATPHFQIYAVQDRGPTLLTLRFNFEVVDL